MFTQINTFISVSSKLIYRKGYTKLKRACITYHYVEELQCTNPYTHDYRLLVLVLKTPWFYVHFYEKFLRISLLKSRRIIAMLGIVGSSLHQRVFNCPPVTENSKGIHNSPIDRILYSPWHVFERSLG